MFAWKVNLFSELSAGQLYQILKLRQDIFVLEQTCLYADLDNLDQKAVHISLISEEFDELVGYCRILPKNTVFPEVSIGRVIVAEGSRRQGLANKVMQKAIYFINTEMDEISIKISAQCHLQTFYKSLGFSPVSEVYDEDGIQHIDMLLENKT